ncbi:MAG: TonB-dependent receptor, partial [Nitrospira sp.]|nr:TonB-dependent receptor [Nitrospira sp.]
RPASIRKLAVSMAFGAMLLTPWGNTFLAEAGFQEEPVQDDTSTIADLSEMSIDELMKVEIVSLAKTPRPLSESAAAVFVINQEDIRRSGATSIPEALRMAPGINVARIDANKWALTARGFNDRYSAKLLVMIDGRTIYTPFFAGTYWELQDYALEDIDRIEVIRGPGGSLWGANAVNGVINIITKKSRDTQGALASLAVGSEEAIGTVRYGGKIGEDFHFRIFGKGFNRDTSVATGGAHDDWGTGRLGMRADWQISPSDTLTIHGNYLDGRAGDRVTLPQLGVPFGTRTLDEDNHLSNHSVLANWSHEFSHGSTAQLRFYYDQYRRDSRAIGERIRTYDVDFQHHLPLPYGNKITWGLGYRLMTDQFRTSDAITMARPSRKIPLYSAFIQDEISLLPNRVFLTLGSKFIHNVYTGFEVQPSGRLLWRATDDHSLWLSVSHAVRTPDRFREEASLNVVGTPFGPVSVTNNSRLVSERVIAYELGYRGQLAKQLSVDLATFFNSYDRLLHSQSISPLTSQHTNNLEGHTVGVEVAAEWQPITWWTLRPAYTYQHTHIFGSSLRNREGTSPNHQLSLQSRFTWEQWEFDTWYRYVERLTALNVPGYHTLDVRLGWHLSKSLSIDAIGQNLLDKAHPEFRATSGGTQHTDVQRAGLVRLTWRY